MVSKVVDLGLRGLQVCEICSYSSSTAARISPLTTSQVPMDPHRHLAGGQHHR